MPLDKQGLVLLRGENLDEGGSNGAGKSTPFELLYQLFYDKLTKTDRKVRKADLLNVHRPKNFLLRLDLSVGQDEYQVDQFRSHTKLGTGLSVVRNGINVTPNDPREARKMVSGLTGLSSNEYLGRVYLSQRHNHMIIDGTPAQKREYLSRCFGWDTLDLMVKETTKRFNAIPIPDETHLKAILQGVEQDIDALGSPEDLEAAVTTALERQSKTQGKLIEAKVLLSKQESARAAEEQRRSWSKSLEEIGLELDTAALQSFVSKARKAVDASRQRLSAASKREELEAKLAAEDDVVDAEVDSEEALATISKRLSSLERSLPGIERREKLDAQLERLPSVEESLDLLGSRTKKWNTKLSEVRAQSSALAAEISKLRAVDDVCYTCLRPISSHEKHEMLREREEALKPLRVAEEKAQRAADSYKEKLSILESRTRLLEQLDGLPSGTSAAVQQDIKTLKSEQSRVQALSKKIARVRMLREQLEELQPSTHSSAELEKILETRKGKLKTAEAALQWALQYGDLNFDSHALQRAYGSVTALTKELEALNLDLLSAQEKLTKYQGLQKQKDSLNKTLNSASEEKSRSRVLRYINVTLGELKKLSLRESSQLLSNVLPIYLNQLFPDGSIKLSVTDDADGFDLMFNKGGHSIPLTLISGGQAKRVGIAIVFAFAKMGRNTTNLLICDEPFRDLDQKGREACFELIRDFDMDTVLVTSHDQDMNAPRKFDQVWTVRMLNHTSRLYLDG